MNLIEDLIAIPVSNGRTLSGRVWRPMDTGRWPAIIDASPYRAGDIFRPLMNAQFCFLAGHGYVAIAIDIAGSGSSTGLLLDEYEPSEISDLVEAIAWVAQQPWCDGGVGLSGFSWAAFTALRASSKNPPALKAMVLGGVSEDGWRTDIHYLGGVPYTAQVDWAGVMLMFNSLPPDPAQFEGDWRAEWKKRLEANQPFLTRWLSHPTHDDYWNDRAADFSRSSELPLLLYAGLADKYAISVLRIAEQWRGPVRTIIGPWEHAPPDRALRGPAIGFLGEALRWWDRFLKGIETSVMDEAPLRLWLAAPDRQGNLENGIWIGSDWPMDKAVKKTFVLHGSRLDHNGHPDSACITLQPAPPEPTTLSQDLYEDVPAPFDLEAARAHGTFVAVSDPFDEPFEIAPSPIMTCHSVLSEGVVVARLLDIAPDGATVRMTTGAINLSTCKSQDIAIPFQAASWRVERGHRLGLALSADGWPTLWPTGGGQSVSISMLRLVLPQIERLNGAPTFAPPEPANVAMREPLKWIDPVQEALPPSAKDVASLTSISAAHHLPATRTDYYMASRFDLSAAAGNRARAVKSYRVAFERPGWSIRVDTRLELTSTLGVHHIVWKIEAVESGMRIHSVEHATSVNWDVPDPA
jgi:putative CocE/NonD family hydrolase